jgi:hypothetical protein
MAGLAGVLCTTLTAPAHASTVVEQWSAGPFTAQLAIVAGDVNGDGKDDIVSYNTYLYGNSVLLSTGSAFLPQQNWGNGGFWDPDRPGHVNMVGDVDGDGRADAVMVRLWPPSGLVVARSIVDYYGVSRFGTPKQWTSSTISGDHGNLIADLDADGDADVVGIFGHVVLAARSNGTASLPLQAWGPPVRGEEATLAADATGDGRADYVMVDTAGVRVIPANPNWFVEPAQTWTTTPFHGTRKTLAADVDGDGDADLVAVDDTEVRVMRSTGTAYDAPELWHAGPFHGTRETLTADVDGDGDADLVAVNDTDVQVLRSQ